MIRKVLLACGIVAALLYVAATIIGAIFWKGYSTADQSVAANQPTPWMGVYERITIFGYLLWGVALAIGLLRARETTAPAQEEEPTAIPRAVAR